MDQSIIILSDDENLDVNGFRKEAGQPDVLQDDLNKEISGCSIRDEKDDDDGDREPRSRFLDDETDRQELMGMNDAAFLDLVSSDDESNVSHENPRSILGEIAGCEDFANWYGHESFSQPAQSSAIFMELQPTANKLLISSNSPVKRASISIERSVSDGISLDRKRRKRTKEEIIAEQAAKMEARERKKQERLEVKKRIELEKQMANFEREVSAAKKSKCEQNLFCIISLDLITAVGNFNELIRKVFTDRDIPDQFVFDGTGMTVCWKRKILQGGVENNEFVRDEKLIYEEFCIFSMDAQHYDQFKTAEEIAAFVENCLKNFPFPSPQLTLVIYGFLKSQKEKVVDFVMEVFERFRAQTRFIVTPNEYALFIAQMHRSIAQNKRRLEEQVLPIVNIEKGITEGHHLAVISDWWMKMLSQMHRMGTDAQRTIVKTFPNPHVLSKLLRSIPMKDGMEMLADTKMESSKRIGPVLGRKIYLMLTSINGTEIIDES